MKIELLKPHTHAGTLYQPGQSLALDDAAARWLVDAGVARIVAGNGGKNLSIPSKTEEKSE